jgi:hypothetical protein
VDAESYSDLMQCGALGDGEGEGVGWGGTLEGSVLNAPRLDKQSYTRKSLKT